MRTLTIITAAVLPAFAAGTGSEPGPSLLISAEYATVDVPVQPAERHLVQLPGLEFPVRIVPGCPTGTHIDSVSVTVADSRHVFRSDRFEDGPVLEAILTVPSQQVAPLPIENVCSEESPSTQPSLRIPGVLTAHAALRCSSPGGHAVHYEALSLGVEINCPRSAPESMQ